MKVYSPYFQTLHDDQGPVGQLGRGAHYSVLRAIVFHDENGRPTAGTDFNFAVIWDEDHDERVIMAIEECHRRRILSSCIAFGERKGFFFAILAPGVSNFRFSVVSDQIDVIAENGVETDTWSAEIGTIDSPRGIIADTGANVSLYIRCIKMLLEPRSLAPDVGRGLLLPSRSDQVASRVHLPPREELAWHTSGMREWR